MSHPLFILIFMWFRRQKTTTSRPPSPASGCRACVDGLAHCHGTLVLHADGVLDCAEAVCGADPSLHEWWLTCMEFDSPCGCVGDEGPLAVEAQAA